MDQGVWTDSPVDYTAPHPRTQQSLWSLPWGHDLLQGAIHTQTTRSGPTSRKLYVMQVITHLPVGLSVENSYDYVYIVTFFVINTFTAMGWHLPCVSANSVNQWDVLTCKHKCNFPLQMSLKCRDILRWLVRAWSTINTEIIFAILFQFCLISFWYVTSWWCQQLEYTPPNDSMMSEWQNQTHLEGSSCVRIKTLSGNLPAGAEKIHENLSKDN
jgi:hypothetical protein